MMFFRNNFDLHFNLAIIKIKCNKHAKCMHEQLENYLRPDSHLFNAFLFLSITLLIYLHRNAHILFFFIVDDCMFRITTLNTQKLYLYLLKTKHETALQIVYIHTAARRRMTAVVQRMGWRNYPSMARRGQEKSVHPVIRVVTSVRNLVPVSIYFYFFFIGANIFARVQLIFNYLLVYIHIYICVRPQLQKRYGELCHILECVKRGKSFDQDIIDLHTKSIFN